MPCEWFQRKGREPTDLAHRLMLDDDGFLAPARSAVPPLVGYHIIMKGLPTDCWVGPTLDSIPTRMVPVGLRHLALFQRVTGAKAGTGLKRDCSLTHDFRGSILSRPIGPRSDSEWSQKT